MSLLAPLWATTLFRVFGISLPLWIVVPLLVYWAVVIVLLIYDNREPSSTLVWLFALIFLPGIGIVLFLFFGRDWKVITARRHWAEGYVAAVTAKMRPVYERNEAADRLFKERYGTGLAADISATIERENGSRPLPADSARDLPHRGGELRPSRAGPGRGHVVHQHGVLHLGARPAHGQDHRDPPRPAGGRRGGAPPLRLRGQHQPQEGRAEEARGGRRQGERRRDPALQAELPQSPQDRGHRRRGRLHGRHEPGAGVHRRRLAVPHLARHEHPRHRTGRRRAAEAVRHALVRGRARGHPAGPLPSSGPGWEPRRARS